jgi:hypothetical protein
MHPKLDDEILGRLWSTLRAERKIVTDHLLELVTSQTIQPRTVALLLAHVPRLERAEKVMGPVREKTRLRRDPEVRRSLFHYGRQVRHIPTLLGLLADHMDDFAFVLATLHAVSPAEAGRAIERHKDALASLLTRDSLAPLLSHNDPDLRLAAIALAGHAHGASERPDEPRGISSGPPSR